MRRETAYVYVNIVVTRVTLHPWKGTSRPVSELEPVSNGAPRQRRVSMADVAKLAGVSSQTVSRVSNGHPGVIPATREVVQAAMRELGYRPNSAARALKWGSFRTIGVILFSLANVGNSKTLEGIAAEATARGYGITLIPVAMPTPNRANHAATATPRWHPCHHIASTVRGRIQARFANGSI